jgi:hypothetical protein
VDVGKSDPTKHEARSPQPGRSGFLNSGAEPSAPALRGKVEAPVVPGSPGVPVSSKGLSSPLNPQSLGPLFSRMGLSFGAEKLGIVQDRVLAALSFLASRPQSLSSGPDRAGAHFQERAAAIYRRAIATPSSESEHAGRARSLAVLYGLFAGQGLDLDPEGLAALSSDLERGGGDGAGQGSLGGEASGNGAPGSREGRETGFGASGDSSGGLGPEAAAGAASGPNDEKADVEALTRLVKIFFRSRGDGPNDWQAFNERAEALDPAWRLIPFAFSANDVDFTGFFRILFRKSDKAMVSLGADFRSNGHDYSFTLRGPALFLEGPELSPAESLGSLAGLARAMDGMGIGFEYSAFRGLSGNGGDRSEGEWA